MITMEERIGNTNEDKEIFLVEFSDTTVLAEESKRIEVNLKE